MTVCHRCGGPMTVTSSCFDGFDLLQCEPCERPIKLLPKNGPRLGSRPGRRGDVNRALRAARRMKQRSPQ